MHRRAARAWPAVLIPLQGPAVNMVRRHARGADQGVSFGPALSTVTGNYVAAKRKGVVNGVDYQYTGVVRFVQVRGKVFQCFSRALDPLRNIGITP